MGVSERREAELAEQDRESDFVGVRVTATDGPDGWRLDGPWRWIGRLWRLLTKGNANG